MTSGRSTTPLPSFLAEAFGHFDPTQARDPSGRWRRVRFLGGTTGAELVKDAAGKQFVLKRGNSPAHVRSEYAANQLYEALGVPVPKTRMEGDTQVAQHVEGPTLKELMRSARPHPEGDRFGDQADLANAQDELAKGLAADALLGNWDSIGLEHDNVIVPAKRPPVRIDNGGALGFRAQGAPKGPAWGPQVTELGTLRDPSKNAAAASVFGRLKDADVVGQIRRIDGPRFVKKVGELEKSGDLSREDGAILRRRLSSLHEWANRASAPALPEGVNSTSPGTIRRGNRELRVEPIGGGWWGIHEKTTVPATATIGGGAPFDENLDAVENHGEFPSKAEAIARAQKMLGGRLRVKEGRTLPGMDSPFLPPLEEAYGAKQRQILSGRGQPSANTFNDHGVKNPAPKVPKVPGAKKSSSSSGSSSSNFNSQHPRGTGTQGGQFIRKGASGAPVAAVQHAVGAPVSPGGGVTTDKPGSFGYSTAASVRAFQKKHGLQVDGVVGRQTAAKILGSAPAAPGQITAQQTHGLSRLAKRVGASGARTSRRAVTAVRRTRGTRVSAGRGGLVIR